MSITIKQLQDMIALLDAHPELRRRLLGSSGTEPARGIRRPGQERPMSVESALEALAEAQRHSEERLTRVEAAIEALTEAQRRTEECLQVLIDRVDKLSVTVGDMKGTMLEIRYRERAAAYFGSRLRRLQVVPVQQIEETLEAVLSDEEVAEVYRLDLLVRGRLRGSPDGEELWLAVEVSAVVDPGDVMRAARRAALLRRAGLNALPVVAGDSITSRTETALAEHAVALALDGHISGWDEARAARSG
jgi:hypothetical protein